MTIPAEEFLDDRVKKEVSFQGNNQKAILEFLRGHSSEAFTQVEIKNQLGIEYIPSVYATLHSLRFRGLVGCKLVDNKKYWYAVSVEEKGDGEKA